MSDQIDHTSFPLKEHLGFTIHRGEGTGATTLQLGEQHMNPNGVAHGSVAFAMMDTAMGAATMTVIDDGCTCATIEIHTRFHRAASEGSLTAEATVLSAGRRVVHLQARTLDSDGRLIASATGSFAVIRPS
ncbi:MAG: PaaI family thioesterase [Acidimicrobiales bacterium]